MIPIDPFDRPVAPSGEPQTLVQFFRESPLVGVELDLERDKDVGRDLELGCASADCAT
jgi:hypothetical protein